MLSDAPTGVPRYLVLMPVIREWYSARPVDTNARCCWSK